MPAEELEDASGLLQPSRIAARFVEGVEGLEQMHVRVLPPRQRPRRSGRDLPLGLTVEGAAALLAGRFTENTHRSPLPPQTHRLTPCPVEPGPGAPPDAEGA